MRDEFRRSFRVADSQLSRLSGPTRFNFVLNGSAAQELPADCRTGTEPDTRAPTRAYEVRQAWKIHPGHGSRDIRAFGPPPFHSLPGSPSGHRMPVDDRMAAKVDAGAPTGTCDVRQAWEIHPSRGSTDIHGSGPTRF